MNLQPPMSRAYAAAAWPVRAFNVMAKPVGAACNLGCEYCYYSHHQRSQETENRSQKQGNEGERLSDEALERFIAEYIQSQDNPTVFFGWQGGEPTLAGLDFYRKVVELQQKHPRPGMAIVNTLQTNGTLLDEQWCDFLATHNFYVGISVDGPPTINDSFRTGQGAATHKAVREAIACLISRRITFNTLTTVTRANVREAVGVYQHLTADLGVTSLQFQPCVERKDFRRVPPGCWPAESLLPVGDSRLQPGAADSAVTDWSISGQEWGTFLCELFDLWWSRDRGRVAVNLFDSWASQFVGGPGMHCMSSPVCGRSVILERDGLVYSCDHYVYEQYCIGRLGDGKTLSDLVRSKPQRDFGEAKSRSLPGYCRRCPFLFACYGECPKRRFVRTPEGEPGLNYLCGGFRTFFHHAGKRLTEYGKSFASSGFSPSCLK